MFRSLILNLGLGAVVFFAAMSSDASAQTRVRVTIDQATIWSPGFTIALTIVKVGTELNVVARQGDWYEVVLPSAAGVLRATGFISVRQVEIVTGPPPPPRAPTASGAQRQAAVRAAPEGIRLRAFGQVSGSLFDARESFTAVLGQSVGVFYGGGGEVQINRLFIQGMMQRFSRNGERVFVFEGNTFKLGIPETVTITPIAFTVGWRLRGRTTVPYVGVGAGVYHYRETSTAGDSSDDIDNNITSYHVLVGAEWRSRTWLTPALEVQYTHVPRALNGGVAASFDEHNLGGLEVRVKVGVGK